MKKYIITYQKNLGEFTETAEMIKEFVSIKQLKSFIKISGLNQAYYKEMKNT